MEPLLLHALIPLSLWVAILVAAFSLIVAASRGNALLFGVCFVCSALIGYVLYLIVLPYL